MTWQQIKTFLDNALSIFRPRSLTFDLSSLHLSRNISTTVKNHWTFFDEVTCKNSIFRIFLVHWPWLDLAQILISSSTPHGAPLCQVWWKSIQGFLRYRVNEVKIAYLDQVYWPLTLGGSRPKSNHFVYSSWCTPVPSLMKIHPGVLEILH